MNAEIIRDYCLLKKGTEESFPFDESTLVFKVMGKIFVLMNLDGNLSLNLKCDPEKAIELREHYPSITPGYHMNKKHWNTVLINDFIPNELVFELIDLSYYLVKESLTKKLKDQLLNS